MNAHDYVIIGLFLSAFLLGITTAEKYEYMKSWQCLALCLVCALFWPILVFFILFDLLRGKFGQSDFNKGEKP